MESILAHVVMGLFVLFVVMPVIGHWLMDGPVPYGLALVYGCLVILLIALILGIMALIGWSFEVVFGD